MTMEKEQRSLSAQLQDDSKGGARGWSGDSCEGASREGALWAGMRSGNIYRVRSGVVGTPRLTVR